MNTTLDNITGTKVGFIFYNKAKIVVGYRPIYETLNVVLLHAL